MASKGTSLHRCIHWFRKGLRLHDNPALLAAHEGSSMVYPIFILDPWFVSNAKVGINRWRFLMQCLQDLDDQLKKLGSRLYVVRGKPTEVFPELFQEWKITKLTFEVDTEPYAIKRDADIGELAEKHSVVVDKRISHTLYATNSIIKKNGGSAPLTYQRCQTVISQLGPPAKPVPELATVYPKGFSYKVSSDAKYDVPTLKELGVDEKDLGKCFYPGGESEALKRMEKNLNRINWVCAFEKPKTEPNTLEPSTTVLSPYLKFGCLSPRKFYWLLKDIYQGKKHTSPPVSLEGQLLWREFFYTVGFGTPNFDKMEGNPVCRQIPWDNNQEFLDAWKNGQTGFPFIDAIMTQLREEGWIHHLARHAVACFLTRGDLWCHWEEGMKVFEEWLLDADWSLNAGNWMWLSASAFFHQYFRVYSPIAFGKKTDKFGNYIKKYIPALKKYPVDYIYEPWKAPMGVQKAAGCIIGKDYPKPIVDHAVVSKENISRMKKAYDAAKGAAATSPQKKRKDKDGQTPKSKRQKKDGKMTDFIKKKN